MRLMRVLLPQPEGPTMTLRRPASTSKAARSTTTWRAHSSPNVFVTFRHSTRPSISRPSEEPAPRREVAPQTPDDRAADGAAHAHARHPDDHLRDVAGRVGLPGQEADARAPRDHLGGDQHHPRDAHPDGGAGDDGGQRPREDDLPEDIAALGAEGEGGPFHGLVDVVDAVDRVD